MSSPWAKIQPPEPTNLKDIMSEEVAKDLQAKEDKKYADSLKEYNGATDNELIVDSVEHKIQELPDDICESDRVIAMMLQKQFDKEHDDLLKRTENQFNGSSKVSISYSNYRRTDDNDYESDSDDEIIDVIDRRDWDRFDTVQRSMSAMPRCGYIKQGGNVVTKHDMTMSGRKNACKFMSFPPEFQTGDGAGFDLQLSNKVFNSLKAHSSKEQARRHRIHDKKEDHATAEMGIDEFTRLLLYKLINKQLLESVNGIISTGKEAVILHADSDSSYPDCVLPKECVIKVFKTTLSEFKQRDKYIKDDFRFKDRYGKQNSRKMVQLWAEKEMHNLVRLQKAGIPCPEVIALKKHVLVMSFIGENHLAAPKLKDAVMKFEDKVIAYEQVVNTMKVLYGEANLIHADLSEYNILWYKGQCWFIDVGQAVEPTHPNAFHFLFRDCGNISTFFNRRGVPDVKSPEELFTHITGYNYHDKKTHKHFENKSKIKPHLVDQENLTKSQFDDEWEISQGASNVLNETENLKLVDPPLA